MKPFLINMVLFGIMMSVSSNVSAEPLPIKVFILAGQSNAVGYNHIREITKDVKEIDELTGEHSPVLFWPGTNSKPEYSGKWIPLRLGCSSIAIEDAYKDGCFGPEIGFAMSMHKEMPGEKIAIIKYAVGATGIAWSKDYSDYIPGYENFNDQGVNCYPQSDSKPGGVLYQDLMQNVKTALDSLQKQGFTYEIAGFLWMQGEHEAGLSKKMAEQYDVLLDIFRKSVRCDLHSNDMPFIVGEINSHDWAFGDIARESQVKACNKDSRTILIKTTDLPREGVGGTAHFDADGMLLLGERFAQGVLKLHEKYPYQNSGLTVEERVKDLLGRMTLHEKILQMMHFQGNRDGNGYGCVVNTGLDADSAAAAFAELQRYFQEKTRWGIPALICTEALHGVHQGNCTIYPQALAVGSTFNPELVKKMVEMMAKELKAMHIRQVLAPDLDLARELRWGRVEETYGEDPFLSAALGVVYVQTMQQNGIVCTPKHFVAHGSPTGGLNLASVSGGEREFRSIYLYPFEKVIRQANPWSLMNCYSSYDGEPVAGSYHYLTELLREELGFKGYVYSDWGSINLLHIFHHTASDNVEAAKQALEAGIDVEATGNLYLALEKMVQEKTLDIRYIDTAVSRVLYVKFASGLFDNPISEGIDVKQVIHSKESIDLAMEIAGESIVLLKNDQSILPLSANKYKSIALIGPNADQFQPGDYSWTRKKEFGVTPLQGIQSLAGNTMRINYAQGCDAWSNNKDGFGEAILAAKESDLAVIVVGTVSSTIADNANSTSGEGFDLHDIRLPGVQEELIKEIKALNKPIVVVLVAGKPLAIPWIKDNAEAILVQWYGGEQQGHALAGVLFGKINPSGRLNVSFPQSVGHLPCYYNHLPTDKGYYHIPGSSVKPGRDYVFSNPDSLWNFGHGLSYTAFRYVDAVVSKNEVADGDIISIDVTVENTGKRDGTEVIQLYVRDVVSSVVTPVKQLKAFSKVQINAGQTKTVHLVMPVSELTLYNKEMKKIVEPGEYELQIGAASDDIRITKKINVVNPLRE